MASPAPTWNMAAPALRRRLLGDVAELRQDPYPNVHFFVDDGDISHACVILTPPLQDPLHFEVRFPHDYPLQAPTITIQSHVEHPNVFGEYICASILNTDEGWTPAYTLRGVLIQLLSFFSSDEIEQDWGGRVDLQSWRAEQRASRPWGHPDDWTYHCDFCGFHDAWKPPVEEDRGSGVGQVVSAGTQRSKLFELPDEVVLDLLSPLDATDIASFADAVPTIKPMLDSYDLIRIRELQCFCLKKSYQTTKLGIGVSVTGGRKPVFRSEFDLLSNEAYNLFSVRKSIQGVPFDKWLPLPLSRRHWNSVRQNAAHALEGLRAAAQIQDTNKAAVLYHFMNTVVVQFSNDADRSTHAPSAKSTLSHASEKAVEAYFALFHLLLCLATDDPSLVTAANRTLARFLAGPRSKSHFPDLGHVLVAALLSDAGLTPALTLLLIKEAILRNVVWLLDARGSALSELAYLEPSPASAYRLHHTFAGSRTSYRLLMFLKHFAATARPAGASLPALRDALFASHGAPPPGTRAAMADAIRAIHAVDSFPRFLNAMGIADVPSKTVFTAFLRRTIHESVAAGYSRMPMTQSQLYMLRRVREPGVEVADGVCVTPALQRWFEKGEKWFANGWNGRPSFFPEKREGGEEKVGRGRGGRARGGGRGRGRGA